MPARASRSDSRTGEGTSIRAPSRSSGRRWKVAPRSAEAHNWLGVALSEKSDLPGAIAAFRRAIRARSEVRPCLHEPRLGPGHQRRLHGSGRGLREGLLLEPNNLGAHFNLGLALRAKGDLEAALPHLRGAALGDPTSVLFRYELGQTLRQSGDLGARSPPSRRPIELDPEKREAYYALGAALRQQGALARRARPPAPQAKSPADEAQARAPSRSRRVTSPPPATPLAEALRLDESHADAHRLLGFVLGQLKDLPQALTHLERAVALRPQSPEAHYSLGVARWYSGSRDQAIAELRRSLVLDPAAGDAHAFLGTALRETGDLAGARASLQRAIALLLRPRPCTSTSGSRT
jgi:tetratricopeptide (TPR) repeat protein